MKFAPESRNALKIWRDESSALPQPQSVPKVMVPRQKRETRSPLRPSKTYWLLIFTSISPMDLNYVRAGSTCERENFKALISPCHPERCSIRACAAKAREGSAVEKHPPKNMLQIPPSARADKRS